jgi:hypothetical protein
MYAFYTKICNFADKMRKCTIFEQIILIQIHLISSVTLAEYNKFNFFRQLTDITPNS